MHLQTWKDLLELGDVLCEQRRVTSELEQVQGRIVPYVFHRHGKRIAARA